jgi:hypothetical protein
VWRKRLLGAAAFLTLGACVKNTYTTGLASGGADHEIRAPFYILGLVGDVEIRLDELCPHGVAWFQNRMDVGDCVFGVCTLGLYTPRTVEVRCAGGQAFLLEEDPASEGTWVTELEPQTASPSVGGTR